MLAHCRKMFPCYTMKEEGGRGGDLSELSTHCHMNRRVYINKFSDSIAGGTGCFLQHTLMRIMLGKSLCYYNTERILAS